MNPPCKDCPDRRSGCHSHCEKYIAYTVELEKMREDKRREYAIADCRRYHTQEYLTWKKKFLRRKRDR